MILFRKVERTRVEAIFERMYFYMKKIKIVLSDSYIIRASDLTRPVTRALCVAFTYRNPQYYKTKHLGFSTKGISPQVQLYEKRGKFLCFPRGEFLKLQSLLESYNFSLEVQDKRITVPLNKQLNFKKGFKLWTSQEEARDIALSEEQGIVHGVCGSGKTEILLSIFAALNQRTLVVIDKLELMKQWVKRVRGRFSNIKIATIGAGKWNIGDITIGSQKTLIKHIDKLKNQFGVILCDELHHYAAPTFQYLISLMPAKYRVGATATLERKDQKEFLIYAAFGKVLYRITDEDLTAIGKIFEVEMVIVPTNFECSSYVELEKNYLTNKSEVLRYNYNLLLNKLKADKNRNALILKIIKKEVKAGHKCLIMADRVAHCIHIKRLMEKAGVKVGLMVGEEEFKVERATAPKRLKSGKISCIVVSPLAQEGFDLPELDRGFIISPSASNSSKLQQQSGRVKRIAEGKKSAKVYYFWDKKIHGFNRHLNNIQKVFKKAKIYVERQREF